MFEVGVSCLHIEIDNDDEFAMLESEILSALIATIYDAAPDPDLWTVALEGIRDLVGGCAANFHWQDERARVFHWDRHGVSGILLSNLYAHESSSGIDGPHPFEAAV